MRAASREREFEGVCKAHSSRGNEMSYRYHSQGPYLAGALELQLPSLAVAVDHLMMGRV